MDPPLRFPGTAKTFSESLRRRLHSFFLKIGAISALENWMLRLSQWCLPFVAKPDVDGCAEQLASPHGNRKRGKHFLTSAERGENIFLAFVVEATATLSAAG